MNWSEMRVVFSFEFFHQARKKGFRISTAIVAAALFVFVLLSPKIFAKTNETIQSQADGTQEDAQEIKGGIVCEDPELAKIFPFTEEHTYDSEEALREAVRTGKEKAGYVILDETHMHTIYSNYASSSSSDSNRVSRMLSRYHLQQQLKTLGVSQEQYEALQQDDVQNQVIVLGTDSTYRYVAKFIFVMLVYMIVIAYGQMVAVAVAREKDSKTMELLVTSTDPVNLILGKVFGTICVVLTAVLVYVFCFLAAFLIVKNQFPPAVLTLLHTSVPAGLIVTYLVYFLLALSQCMFLFAALGSTVSRVEDVSSATTPVMLLIIVSYMVAFMALQGPDLAVVRVCSWIPFISALVMPIRFANASAGALSVTACALINLAFMALMAWASIRIYRWGTLHYGNRMNLVKVLRRVFSKS